MLFQIWSIRHTRIAIASFHNSCKRLKHDLPNEITEKKGKLLSICFYTFYLSESCVSELERTALIFKNVDLINYIVKYTAN